MSCFIVCIAFTFYVSVLNILSYITVLYCIDGRLSNLSKDHLLAYLLTYLLTYLKLLKLWNLFARQVRARPLCTTCHD